MFKRAIKILMEEVKWYKNQNKILCPSVYRDGFIKGLEHAEELLRLSEED